MNLRTRLSALVIVALLLGAAGTTAIFHSSQLDLEILEASQKRLESLGIADELRQSSDDLTTLARIFVVTGDERFEEYFERVLEIRDGIAPRPLDYANVYWDLVVANGQPPRGDGVPVALHSRMEQMGFTEDEFQALEGAEGFSNELAVLEREAFAARKGRFGDGAGGYTVEGPPDPELATGLLFSRNYLELKGQIAGQIAEFTTMVDARTGAELDRLRGQRRAYFFAGLGILLFTVLGVLMTLPRAMTWVRLSAQGSAAQATSSRSIVGAIREDWPIVAAGVAIIVVILAGTSWNHYQVLQRSRQDIGNSLTTVVGSTSEAVEAYLEEHRVRVTTWAVQGAFQEIFEQLNSGADASATSFEEYVRPILQEGDHESLSVVAADGTRLAFVGENESGLSAFEEELRGFVLEVGASPRGVSIRLPGRSGEGIEGTGLDRLWVGSSVGTGSEGGVLLLVVDPTKDFTEILQRGRIGKSGESYAFNRAGQLISESRFDDQLRGIGLIEAEQRGILNIEIRDPGVNLVEGADPVMPRSEMHLTLMVRSAIDQGSGRNLEGYRDYRGVPVIGAWVWDEASGIGITTEIDVAEAFETSGFILRGIWAATIGACALMALLVGVFIVYRARGRKLMSQVLASEERAQRMLDSTPDPMIIVDDKGVMLFANQKVSTVLGYTREELIGNAVEMLVPDRIRDTHPAIREAYTADPQPISMHDREGLTARAKDGQNIPISLSLNPINIEGEGMLVAAALRDETERVETMRKIEEQKVMLENTIESLTHPFYVIDAKDYTIQLANSAARKLGIEEMGVSRCHEVTHKSDKPCDSVDDPCPLVEILRTKKPVTLEHIHYDAEGNRFYAEVHGYPVFDAEGNVVQMIEYSHDITERKRMELELREAQEEAESASRAKSAFLANMSHELRTPMNAIIGYSEMLMEDAEDEDAEDMIPDLKKIHVSGTHLLALINDILDLSKVEAGRMDLYLESFDLKSMLEDSLASVEPLIAKNSNTLVMDFPDDLGMLRADMTKIRQALLNLVSNAAKFTDEGTVTVAARRERAEDADTIRIEVTDTGIGIPEDKIDRVFEEFGQADESTTREYGGTGLGLPISRKFCRMMGGDIVVESRPGQGSTFSIIIPAQVDALEAARAIAPAVEVGEVEPGAVGGRNHVLVIDDDPNARELLKRTLEGEGYSVITASGGAEGLNAVRDVRPSVITLDVQMPGMDGWTVLKALKADADLRNIPVIMVSIVGDQKTGYALGAVESLSKPVDREALLSIVSRYTSTEEAGKVLIVEDDANNRALLVRTMASAGWTVLEAENGAVGLSKVAEGNPDLILLDLMMPVMDGFEFVLELRNEEAWRDIPVIVVTAKDLTEEDRFRLTGGVESIIQKGAFSREKFLTEVSHLVHRHDPVDGPNNEGAKGDKR